MKTFFLLIVVAVLAAPVLAAHADTLNPECSNQAIPQVQTLEQLQRRQRDGVAAVRVSGPILHQDLRC